MTIGKNGLSHQQLNGGGQMKCWLGVCLLFGAVQAWAQEGVAQEPSEDIDASVALHQEDAPVGLMTSYIYKNQLETHNPQLVNPNAASPYSSFGIGPSIKLSPHVMAYGVVGAAADAKSQGNEAVPLQALTLDDDARMYGVGMQIRPNSDWQIDVKYQNANLDSEDRAGRRVNYFNLGIGYKFW